jgi:hypothetical protein
MAGSVDTSHEALDRFVGHWIGEGTTSSGRIRDEAHWYWTVDDRFLRMEYRAIECDTFQADGYFWYNSGEKRFEFYEFNNKRWPVCFFSGQWENGNLALEEKAADRHMRLVFTWHDADTFSFIETDLHGEQPEPRVSMTFRRQPDVSG